MQAFLRWLKALASRYPDHRIIVVDMYLFLAMAFGTMAVAVFHLPWVFGAALVLFNLALLWWNHRSKGTPLAALGFWLESTWLPWLFYWLNPTREVLTFISHGPLLVLTFLALYFTWPRNLLMVAAHTVLSLALTWAFVPQGFKILSFWFEFSIYSLGFSFVLVEYIWEQARKRVEETRRLYQEVERQQKFLESVIDAVDGPFYVIDPQTYQVILANKRAREYGISTQSHMVTCYALTHRRDTPCSGDEHPCPLQHVLEHGTPTIVEHIHYRADGTPYIAEVHAFPIKDEQGRVKYMVEYSLDITARKKAEEWLRMFQRASEYSAHGILITDPQGTILYVNPAFTRMTGYTYEEAVGQTPRILKSGKHDREFYRNLWNTIRSGKVWSGEMINRRKDGTLYYEEQTIAPVFDEKGNITHFVAVKQDVTPRKRMEAALERARRRAEEANRFKTRLLGSLGHDIRAPLSLIFTLSENLLADDGLSPEHKEFIRQIVLATAQMQDFAEGLLTYARLDEKGLQIAAKPIDRETLNQRLEGLYGFIARQKGLAFQVVWEDELTEVYGDPTWVLRAIGNLVSNAIRYTPEGGRVEVRFWKPDEDHWAVTVADTGPGIPEDVRERLFEPFATGANRRGASMGLGLYIVREVVQAHGGQIQVDTAPNQGTRITLLFPNHPPTDH